MPKQPTRLPTFQQVKDAEGELRDAILKEHSDTFKDVKISGVTGAEIYYSDGYWANCIAKIQYIYHNDSSHPLHIMPSGLEAHSWGRPVYLDVTEKWYAKLLDSLPSS